MNEERIKEILKKPLQKANEDFCGAYDKVAALLENNSEYDENYEWRLRVVWDTYIMSRGIVIGLERALDALTKGVSE